jgi:hypothetical protein
MSILLIVITTLAVAIAGFLIYAATKPDTFRVARSTTINAAPDKIFPLIDDYHRWGSWSPYENIDPAMQRTFSGAPSGKGAVYEWTGNKKIGHGRMEIMESSPPSRVLIKLDFFSPFEAHNTAEFALQPKGNATNVTWSMVGPLPYMAKVMHMFFNMDKMVGSQFAEGLANMKAVAEA